MFRTTTINPNKQDDGLHRADPDSCPPPLTWCLCDDPVLSVGLVHNTLFHVELTLILVPPPITWCLCDDLGVGLVHNTLLHVELTLTLVPLPGVSVMTLS
jgi:hypothetical protein